MQIILVEELKGTLSQILSGLDYSRKSSATYNESHSITDSTMTANATHSQNKIG